LIEYDVRVSEPAEGDIDAIFQYLFTQSVERSEDWRDEYEESARSLTTLPHRCSPAPESGHFDRPIRQLWFGKKRNQYRIIYTVFEDADPPFVLILRVRHHSQQPINVKTETDME
jgi:plasmid stabilization system protein ParE